MPLGLILAAIVAASAPPGGVFPSEQAAYDAMVAAKAREADQVFAGSPCSDAQVQTVSVTPWKIANRPDLLLWRQQVRVAGCGRSSLENLYIGRSGGQPPWQVANGLPGDSLADMTLQQNVFPEAVEQTKVDASADCKGPTLHDIYVAARPGHVDLPSVSDKPPQAVTGRLGLSLPPAAEAQRDKMDIPHAWAEIWPFESCGVDRTLLIVFVPARDQQATYHLVLPIWRLIAARGPDALPKPAPAD